MQHGAARPGDGPLAVAAYHGHVDVVEVLLGAGAQLQKMNNDGALE